MSRRLGIGEGFKFGLGLCLAVIVIVAVLVFAGVIQLGTITQPTQPQPQPQPPTTVSVTKPIQFSVQDPLKGQAVGSASIYIYDTNKVLLESLTTGSSGSDLGKATTIQPYKSGTMLKVKVAKSGYVTVWYDIVVPEMTPADAQSLATNYVPLQVVTLGTYTIKITDQFGNVYTSPASINFTALNVQTLTLTISIYNTVDNTGYKSSYDYLNGINLNAVLQLSTGGSSVVVQGAGQTVTRGTTTYWLQSVSDDGLTRQLQGNVYVKPGVTSVTITVNKGSLAAGSSQAFTLNLMAYFDISYFSTNGIGGPDATTLTTYSLTFKA